MKLALIPPDGALFFARQGDIHFILQQRCKNRKYREFYKRETKWKIIDNGAYEGILFPPWEDYIEIAKEVEADVVILYDYPFDRKSTLNSFREQHLTSGLKEMAVPHGKTPLEWVKTYRDIARLEPDIIGLSVLIEKRWRCRRDLIRYLVKKNWWCETIDHHLLGLDQYSELYHYHDLNIKSVDTSLPFTLACKGRVPEDIFLRRPPAKERCTDVRQIRDLDLAADLVLQLKGLANYL